jgi:hypothetical protein
LESIGAEEVAPGRCAVPLGGHYYIAPESDLVEYANADKRIRAFIAATWKALPAWWSPERRFAALVSGTYHPGTLAVARHFVEEDFCRGQVVTADLETGEEVGV